jgi:signal transduction histidine kinase
VTRRILGSYAAFALVVLLALEVPLAVLGAHRYRSLAVDQAEKVATALAVAANANFEAGDGPALQALVLRYREQTGGEVAVVDRSGIPIASADDDRDNDSTTVDRPWVHSALGGTVAGGVTDDEARPTVVAAAPLGDASGPNAGAVVVSVSADPTTDRIHLFWAALGGVAVAVLAAALLIGWWLARTVTRPLARLRLAVQAFGEPDLDVRANDRQGPPEVVALARQFNHMADQLRDLVDAQNRFVADASHQLRSPLAALRLRIENLEADLDPSRAATARAVDAELQRLSRLVDGLINLGNAEATAPVPVPVALDGVVRDRVEVWSALAEERGVRLELGDLEPWVAPVTAGDLEQILDNLLDNALDVSPPGAAIALTTRGDGRGGAEVSIADEGPGMTDEQLARAFDRFWRDRPQSGAAGGLGLAIVRQLASRNTLEVQLARRPGGGIEATVRAPRATRASAPVRG